MNLSLENNGTKEFAIGEDGRDLRGRSNAPQELEVQLDPDGRYKQMASSDTLEALKPGPGDDRRPHFDSVDDSRGDQVSSRGGPWYQRVNQRTLLAALLLMAIAAVAPFAWNYVQSYESTDDAEIDGHIDPLSSRIDGTVVSVHPEDDDRVKKGELLVEIDPRDYEVAVERAKAQLELARAQVASAKQVVPQQQYDQYIATARVDAAAVDAEQEAAGSALKVIAAREADADAAKAALDQAFLNLSYTKIYAPANGIVGKRAVQLGSRIQPGQTLMFVTETDDIWVTANFKETQLAHMHRGEKVTVHVDTFGRNYRGYVAHMPGASGDRFSLLPPENATGNYVKVVQRLPVRIVFEQGQDPHHLLHPGMSAEPTVWLLQSHRQ